ncbi:MAG: hypothetical protein E2O92_05245 [Alphaproteobacteria bacterium]|nr:MAG: hypothetical protein E2O92_05245 [Alphaproteobacteria bacterium]
MYFLRMIAWAFLFLALAGWGAECLYSMEVGAYRLLTPAIIWQSMSPQTLAAFTDNGSIILQDFTNAIFLLRPVWLMPAVVSVLLFLGVRRRRKKWMFRDN